MKLVKRGCIHKNQLYVSGLYRTADIETEKKLMNQSNHGDRIVFQCRHCEHRGNKEACIENVNHKWFIEFIYAKREA